MDGTHQRHHLLTYSPVTPSYSSDAAMSTKQDPEVRAAAVDITELAEDEAGGPAERGRTTHAAIHRTRDRAGSAGADSRQATNRVQKKRRIQDDELKEHIHQEKLDGLAQTATTEELHCVQRRYCQQRGVVPARSRDEYVQEAAAPRGTGWRWHGRLERSDMGTADCSLEWSSPAHTRLQLYILV